MNIPPLPHGLDLAAGGRGPFRELRYQTADLFLHDVSRLGRLFGPHGPLSGSPWLFRGIKDSDLGLIPSAFHADGAAKLFATPVSLWSHLVWTTRQALEEQRSNEEQYEAERRVLCAFFYAADKYGLALPEDSQRLRKVLEEKVEVGWPPDDLLSLLALAQHYGCPTRLLDWTSEGLVAAWFAASGALGFKERGRPDYPPDRVADGRKLVVWALSAGELEFEAKLLSPDSQPSLRHEIQIVSAPRWGNENLHAQHGVFTLTRDRQANLKAPHEATPLDTLLVQRYERHGVFPEHPTVLRLTLPWSKARRLLTLLSRADVCSAALFPGYAGVADALWESRLLMLQEELNHTCPDTRTLQADPH